LRNYTGWNWVTGCFSGGDGQRGKSSEMGRSEDWKTRTYAFGKDQEKCGWYRKPVFLKKILQDSPAPC